MMIMMSCVALPPSAAGAPARQAPGPPLCRLPIWLLRGDRSGGQAGSSPDLRTGLGEGDEGGSVLVCVACRGFITSRRSSMEVDGAHAHTFANPYGYIFRIGCFSAAAGCAALGEESSEFPWFADHTWRLVVCRRCGTQMGWIFRSAQRMFYGLILERLQEERQPED